MVRAALIEGVATILAVGSARNLALQLLMSLLELLKLDKTNVRKQLTCLGGDGQYMGLCPVRLARCPLGSTHPCTLFYILPILCTLPLLAHPLPHPRAYA